MERMIAGMECNRLFLREIGDSSTLRRATSTRVPLTYFSLSEMRRREEERKRMCRCRAGEKQHLIHVLFVVLFFDLEPTSRRQEEEIAIQEQSTMSTE